MSMHHVYMGAAFLKQANSDLLVYDVLSREPLPSCHRLHYLQMWLEKLCKAYIWREKGSRDDLPDDMKHQVISKVLPILLKSFAERVSGNKNINVPLAKKLSREIDLLHPQVDGGGTRPDNVEYPWLSEKGGVQVIAPVDYDFQIMKTITSPQGIKLLKIARALTEKGENWLFNL